MTDAQEAGKMASEPESRCPICDWPIKKTIQEGCVPGNCSFRPAEGRPEYYRIQERRRQLEMDKLPRKPAAASELKYYSVDGVSGPIQPAAASEQPTAAPQVREVIVGLQENIEQLCALLLQRTGEDRGKLAAPTAAAGSAPQWSERELSVIKELSAKLDISEAQVLRQGLRLYQLQVEGLIRVVDAHPELKKLVQGEPGGEK